MVVIFEDGYGEFVLAQVAPDIFHRIEFRGIGRQAEQGHVVGGLYVGGEVIARAVGDEDGMGVRSDLLANFGKMRGESFGVGLWQDERGGDLALWTGGAEDIGPFVALIARRAGARSALRPNSGQRALLTDARFVLEPDFERLSTGAFGKNGAHPLGEFFLNSSCAASSALGCRGRTDSRT